MCERDQAVENVASAEKSPDAPSGALSGVEAP